jgi:hypothetical protein
LLILLVCLASLAVPAVGAEPVARSEANVMIELPFTSSRTYPDPFNQVTLDVIFTEPGGRELRVPAFWAGKNLWKVRYASSVVGTHAFRTDYPDASDTGLHGITGTIEIALYTGHNPLYVHGPLRVAASRRYLEHTDGTPFFWLGDTWWMGLCHRLHWPDEFKTLTADRVEKGFTVVQIVAGLYPDMPPFDPRGANEAGFPWEKDFSRIRPEYFDAADKRLGHLVDSGLTPCIVGAWGYFLPLMGVEKAKQHWRYLIARYGAMPVVWCVAGEANLPYYRAKGFPYDDREQVKGWTEVARYLRATDPFHRPMTIHPTGIGRLSARHAIDDVSLLDIDMLQTPHGKQEAVAPTVSTVRQSYADKPILPVIDGEASYEMLNNSIPTEWTRQMFWLCMMNGTAGHTYGANGIWQCNRRGQPHGPSPTAGSPPTGYGTISWDEAMNLPGSRQVGLGKKLLEQFAWQTFVPHPEWATYPARTTLSLEGCQWIWFPEGNPAQDAPAAKRFFRRAFVLPEGKVVKSAQLRMSADDRFSARLNGKPVGSSTTGSAEGWKSARQFDDIASLLKAGTNVLAVEAENLPSPGKNPAGLIARLEIRLDDGQAMDLLSDDAWRASKSEAPGWDAADFDDAGWPKAMAVAGYGKGPWGAIDAPAGDSLHGPQSTGIPDTVRVTYVPRGDAIEVHQLGKHLRYSATFFDPVSGEKTPLPQVQPDGDGNWKCAPPAGHDHDWVLILQAEPGIRTQ